jgi:hypothetical protein
LSWGVFAFTVVAVMAVAAVTVITVMPVAVTVSSAIKG